MVLIELLALLVVNHPLEVFLEGIDSFASSLYIFLSDPYHSQICTAPSIRKNSVADDGPRSIALGRYRQWDGALTLFDTSQT